MEKKNSLSPVLFKTKVIYHQLLFFFLQKQHSCITTQFICLIWATIGRQAIRFSPHHSKECLATAAPPPWFYFYERRGFDVRNWRIYFNLNVKYNYYPPCGTYLYRMDVFWPFRFGWNFFQVNPYLPERAELQKFQDGDRLGGEWKSIFFISDMRDFLA